MPKKRIINYKSIVRKKDYKDKKENEEKEGLKNLFEGKKQDSGLFADFAIKDELITTDEEDIVDSKVDSFEIVSNCISSMNLDNYNFTNFLFGNRTDNESIYKKFEIKRLFEKYVGKTILASKIPLRPKEDDPFLFNEDLNEDGKKAKRYKEILKHYNVFDDYTSIYKASFIESDELNYSKPMRLYYYRDDVNHKINIILIDMHHLLAVNRESYTSEYIKYKYCDTCLSKYITIN